MEARKSQLRRNFVPYKVLSLLLYGRFSWLQVELDGSLLLGMGPLARLLKTDTTRIREYLTWLEQRNYLEKVELLPDAYAKVYVRFPPNFHKAELNRLAINEHRAKAFEEVKQIVERTDV